jgi:transcriptional regulator with XRE-family HTH domain
MKEYWEILRELREDRDLKQTALADYLQIHQTTYSDYELGKLNVPINVLHALADYYDTSIDYLLGRTPEKKPYPKR